MKNLYHVLSLSLLALLSLKATAQIQNEIKTFVDSTELQVVNGRKLILKELNDNNLVKVLEIYDYLTQLTRNKPISAFYYLEDIYITMLTNDWLRVEELIINYDSYKGKRIYPNSPELISNLYGITSKRSEELLISSLNSSMRTQTKRLVEVLLHLIKIGKPDDNYKVLFNAYKKDYKDTPYLGFEKEFMPRIPVKGSFSFSMGSGGLLTTGNLSKSFPGNAIFIMAMDVNVNKVYSSLYFQGTGLKLKVPFEAVSNSDTLSFAYNERFSYIDVGVRGGYFLVRNDRFHLAPYLSLSGSWLESTRYTDPKDDDLEFKVFNSFTYGLGLHTEVRLHSYTARNYYYGSETFGYLSIKVDAGYSKIARFSDSYFKGDTPYFNVALVWGLGDF